MIQNFTKQNLDWKKNLLLVITSFNNVNLGEEVPLACEHELTCQYLSLASKTIVSQVG